MMGFSDNYYQTLCPADKRKILERLDGFLSKLHDAYGKPSGSKNAVKILIGSNQEIIKNFIELMQCEVYPYNIIEREKEIRSASVPNNGSSAVRNTTNIQDTISSFNEAKSVKKQSVLNKETKIQSEIHEHGEVFLSNTVKEYIDSVVQSTVSNQLDEKIKPIFECLDQYEEVIRVYKERESKLQEENKDRYSALYANGHNINLDETCDSSKQKFGEDCNQKKLVPMSNSKYSSVEKKNVEELENIGLMASLPNDIQEQIKTALDVYNRHDARKNPSIRMSLKNIFNKPIDRLVLQSEAANDFANKSIKDLKKDKTYQTVLLEPTDGSSDYIATPVGESIYAVFPVKFEPYNQSFAWTRAYPLFFEILPNDEMKASSYVLKQPAFFQKKDGRYQMLENGKGCIELVP